MRKFLFLILMQIAASLFFSLHAQSTFSGWLSSFNTFKTGKKTSIHTDIQLRSTDDIRQIQTVLLRPGLNIRLSKYLTLTTGYAFIRNKRIVSNVSGFATEHRIWEQLLVNHKLKNIFVTHRFRLEQRFIAKSIVVNNELKNDGSVYANRFRYFIRNVFPLKREPAFKKGIFAALQNEVFLNFGNTSVVNNKIFDQNRLYLAAGYRFSSVFDLEAGYIKQYINGKNKTFTNNHVLQLASYLRL
jgi:hypothetical protein